MAYQMFMGGGWIAMVIMFARGLYWDIWLDGRQGQFYGKWKWILLAIDIPKLNEQTPKAVENIFSALAGAYTSGNLIDNYWKGKIPESFSFELVSLEGYVQFLVRTPKHMRDLIESSIYSQYPEAEITEVEDYASPYKDVRFPNPEYDLWGSEMMLTKDYSYPIKTYIDFEHTLSGNLIDPIASFLEILGRMGPGEQVWLQYIATPGKPSWGDGAKKIVKELRGEKFVPPETMWDTLLKPLSWINSGLTTLAEAVFETSLGEVKKDEKDQFKMMSLSPGERNVFEKVQRKLSKHPLRTKIRFIYLAQKPVFNKGKGVAAVMGAFQQFNTIDCNGLKPGAGVSKTSADYYFTNYRTALKQNNILQLYIKRSNYYGELVGNQFLCPEELASLWHFPVETVKAPSVETIVAKRAVPPTRLPYEYNNPASMAPKAPEPKAGKPTKTPKKEKQNRKEIIEEPIEPKVEIETRKDGVIKKPAPPSNLPTL